MTDNLSAYRSLTSILLADSALARYSNDLLDLALRQSLVVYSQASPQVLSAVLSFAADGREQSLDGLGAVLHVLRFEYPYDPAASGPRPLVEARLYWSGGSPYVYIGGKRRPATGEQALLHYAAGHTIADLEGAETTSVPTRHAGVVGLGAAAFAARTRAGQLVEAYGARSAAIDQLSRWGEMRLNEFRARLAEITQRTIAPGGPWSLSGWTVQE